jgi:hypothetical protein
MLPTYQDVARVEAERLKAERGVLTYQYWRMR